MLAVRDLWKVPLLPSDGPAPAIFDPSASSFIGFEKAGDGTADHLFVTLEKRAKSEYGKGFNSPLGKQDRLWRSSENLAQFKLEFAQRMNARDAALGVSWDVVVQGSARENPGQGLTSIPDSDLKASPDQLDVEICYSILNRLKRFDRLTQLPARMSFPREAGCGLPLLLRDEATRVTEMAANQRCAGDALTGLAQSPAKFKEAILTPSDGIRYRFNFAGWKGKRNQPGKFKLEGKPSQVVPLSTKEHWLWNKKGGVRVERLIRFGRAREGRCRDRRVIGENVQANTCASYARRDCTKALYDAFDMLPSTPAEVRRITLSDALGYGGDQFDGEGTDTKCPPWLPALYCQVATHIGFDSFAVTMLFVHLFNFGAAAQPSNAWRSPGVSGYGDVTRLINTCYMGVRSGIDPVALMAFLSQCHGVGRTLVKKEIRTQASAIGIRLPEPAAFADWYAECCTRLKAEPGKPCFIVRGDGILVHAIERERAFWLNAVCPDKRYPDVHLTFQRDPTGSSDGKRWIKGRLIWDAPRRLAYFMNADDLRVDRRYLGIALVVLAQAILEWPTAELQAEFVDLFSIATDGAVTDPLSWIESLAQIDIADLSDYSLETILSMASPDKLDYMPEQWLEKVNAAILAGARTYFDEATTASNFAFIRSWYPKLINAAPGLFQMQGG